jgi:hypothetical protein
MSQPPEGTSRKSVTLPDELWEAINEYRHAQRIRTEREAVERLLQRGLDAEARRKPPRRSNRKGGGSTA